MQETKANKPLKKGKFTKQEKDWILYDVANSAFTLLIATILPIYFANLFPEGTDPQTPTIYWGYAASIVTILSAIICPILGTYADFSGKKQMFRLFAGIGIIGCASMAIFGFLPVTDVLWIFFLLIFIIAKTGYTSANVFYDSMIADVTTEDKVHNVSAQGYAWGYIGSCIPFVVCIGLYVISMFVPAFEQTSLALGCLITAAWWFIFMMPLHKSYKQIHFLPRPQNPIKDTFIRLGQIFKELAKNKKALIFLLAFFFYIDGVYTIIDMATSFGKAFGFDSIMLLVALLVTQIVAFPFAILFGKLSSKISGNILLPICIGAYTGIGIFAVFLHYEWQFWVLAVAVGMFQGGIQAMSRSYFTKIIPAEKSGEYFGLYDIFGKGAAFLGTFLVSTVAQITGDLNIGIIPIPCLFVIGLILFFVAAKLPVSEDVKTKE